MELPVEPQNMFACDWLIQRHPENIPIPPWRAFLGAAGLPGTLFFEQE